MEFLLIAGMVVCGWVILCVLSGERQRRAAEIEREEQSAVATADENALRALLQLQGGGGQSEKLTGAARSTRVN